MAVAMTTNPSVADGEKALLAAAAAYRAALGDRLLAAYALGSLAHGGFSPPVSDIDLGLVVDDPLRPDDENTIEVVAAAQKLSDGPLTERLSVFWGTPNTLGGGGGYYARLQAHRRDRGHSDALELRAPAGRDGPLGLPRPAAICAPGDRAQPRPAQGL